MATNVPKIAFGPNGFIAPNQPTILAGVIADINAAFGGGVNPSLSTPQGQLASSEAAIIGNVNDAFLYLAAQMDPAFASGRMQDGIGRIYYLDRRPSQPTSVSANCTGASGTVIPAGSLGVAADGSLYASTQDATIPSNGVIAVPFACTVPGPTPCPAGSLRSIYKAVPGWNTISNPADGVLGNVTESRNDFEARRKASVSQNSRGSLSAVRGAVLNVPGVIDAYVTENVLATPQTIGGVTLAPKSIYVCAVGGLPIDVATAIWSKKAPGCGYNGDTTVSVADSNSGYVPPFPSYAVTFQTALPLSILFNVTLATNTLVPSNAATLVRAAITAAFIGADGGGRAGIGATVLASRFYNAINALGSWAKIINIHIGSTNGASSAFTASATGFVLTVSAVGSGSLAPGQVLVLAADGANAVVGRIVSQTSGTTGGVGTYAIDTSVAFTSQGVVGTLVAADQVATTINEVPTIADSNINVVLV